MKSFLYASLVTLVSAPALAGPGIPSVCPENTTAFVPDGTVSVPISILDGGLLEAFCFDLTFDDALLSFVQGKPGPFTEDWDAIAIEQILPGVIRVCALTTTPEMPKNPDVLVTVQFEISPAAKGASTITAVDFQDDLTGLPDCAGTIQFVRPPDSVCPVDTKVVASDGKARIPIVMTGNAGPLSAIAFDFRFDDTFLTFQSAEFGEFLESWDLMGVAPLGPDHVRIAALTNSPQTPADPETLLVIVMDIDPAASGTAAVTATAFQDDFESVPDCTGEVEFNRSVAVRDRSWGRIKGLYR